MTNVDQSLVAKYTFDGNANDTSDNNHHGKVHGASLGTDRFGNADKAYQFDGVNDYIITNKLMSSPTTETMSLWIYAMAPGVIVSELGQPKLNTGYHYIKLGLNPDNELRGNFWPCNGNLSFGKLNLNQWYHVALVYDGSGEKAYLDGKLKDTDAGIRSGSGPADQYLAFGAADGEVAGGFKAIGYFKGKIDDVSIYKRVLNDSEIMSLYQEGSAEPVVSPAEPATSPAEPVTSPAEPVASPAEPVAATYVATVRKSTDSSSLAEVVDRILEKGIVIDAWAKVSLVGIELLAVEARVVIASVETYLKYAEAIGLTAPIAAPPQIID